MVVKWLTTCYKVEITKMSSHAQVVLSMDLSVQNKRSKLSLLLSSLDKVVWA
jgi:hypothetical protein